jgi:hypothetical protein
MGLPGSALGGMNPHTAGTAMQWAEPYVFSPSLDVMYDVPIQVWSTKSFTARWHTTIRTMPEAELIDENQLLTGSVTNTHDFPWEQCILAYGGSVYDLGAIAPGESARIDAMSKRSELKTLLTGRKVITVETTGDKYRQVATPYDQSSTDIPYILRTMMFYDAAGGPQYTGLSNAYQNFVDLTQLLKADRAILVVQTANDSKKNRHGAALLRDGQALDETQNIHTTIYRFVFPVKKEKTE